MTRPARLAIVGAGGLGREIEWLVREIDPHGEQFRFVGFVVTEARYLSVGDPTARASIAADISAVAPHLVQPALVHPTVRIDHASCHLGRGSIVCAGSIATVAVSFGAHSLVNLAVTVGHDSTIGASSVVNPGANISGNVAIGQRVLVGTGATILEKLTIGDDAAVGAGAVVVRDVLAQSTVVGVPARPITSGSRSAQ
jgi:sugar O-acyltransferase (sialic acid O-acetyltransferase NeuD family)